MAIYVECGHCRAGFKVSQKLIGKRVRCKKCGEVFRVVNDRPSTSVASTEVESTDDTASQLDKPDDKHQAKLRKKQMKQLKSEIEFLKSSQTAGGSRELASEVLDRADAIISKNKADVIQSKAKRSLRNRASQAAGILGGAVGGAVIGEIAGVQGGVEAGVKGTLAQQSLDGPAMSAAQRQEYDQHRDQAAMGGADFGMDLLGESESDIPNPPTEIAAKHLLKDPMARRTVLTQISRSPERITWKVKMIANWGGPALTGTIWLATLCVALSLSFKWPIVGAIAMLILACTALNDTKKIERIAEALRDYPLVYLPARNAFVNNRYYGACCRTLNVLSLAAVVGITTLFIVDYIHRF